MKSEKPEANPKIYIHPRLNELKEKAKINLNSEKGLKLRSLRLIEYETVIGDIKGNLGVRRFFAKRLRKDRY